MPTEITAITRGFLDAIAGDQVRRREPATDSACCRALHGVCVWAADRHELPRSSLKITPAASARAAAAGVNDERWKRPVRAFRGRKFAQRRDLAGLRLMIDVRLRRDLPSMYGTWPGSRRAWKSALDTPTDRFDTQPLSLLSFGDHGRSTCRASGVDVRLRMVTATQGTRRVGRRLWRLEAAARDWGAAASTSCSRETAVFATIRMRDSDRRVRTDGPAGDSPQGGRHPASTPIEFMRQGTRTVTGAA